MAAPTVGTPIAGPRSNGASTTFTGDSPSGITLGDVLVATIKNNTPLSSPTWSALSGWTDSGYTVAVTGTGRVIVLWKYADSTDVANAGTARYYTWTQDTSVGSHVTVMRISGADTSGATPIDIEATFSEVMNSSTIDGSTFTLAKQDFTAPVAAQVTYDSVSKKAMLDPETDLEADATYTATLKGGVGGVKDDAGNPLADDETWSFTTAAACDKYTSTTGNDSNLGTATEPYRTVDKLGESLAAGQTGCVRGRVYDQDVHLANGGSTSSPITIRAYSGESVDFRDTFEVNASNVIIDGLAAMRGEYGDTTVGTGYDSNEVKTWPAIEPNGTNITVNNIGLIENQLPSDPYDHSGQAIQAGSSSNGFKLLNSRIGACGEPNGGNNHQHGVYIGSDNFEIRDNTFSPGIRQR